MDVESAIRGRRTHKRYGPTAVAEDVLRALLDLGLHAPNHHLTEPWRFRVLGPATRRRLEECCGEKEAMRLRRAPTLVLASAALSGDPRTDEEDLHAVACAVYAVLLGATARGLASYWRTPAAFEAEGARAILGLDAAERIVALVHLGHAVSEPPAKGRRPLDAVLTVLP